MTYVYIRCDKILFGFKKSHFFVTAVSQKKSTCLTPPINSTFKFVTMMLFLPLLKSNKHNYHIL